MKMEKYMESELTGTFQAYLVARNILLWSPSSRFCSEMSLSQETYKFSEPDCYTLVFSLLNSKT